MDNRKTLLICDDEEDILEVLALVLSTEYNVHTLKRIRNIADEAAGLNPDVILMDLRIPEIGGEEALNCLKADERTRNIPVLLFSANNNIKRIAKEVRADGYISKPFQIDELKNVLTKFCCSRN